MEKYSLSFKTLLFHSLLLIGQVFSQDSGTAGNPRGQHCRGFNAEEIRKFFLMNRFALLLWESIYWDWLSLISSKNNLITKDRS